MPVCKKKENNVKGLNQNPLLWDFPLLFSPLLRDSTVSFKTAVDEKREKAKTYAASKGL